MGIRHGFCEPRALFFTLNFFFIPRLFVLRWLPHSVLPIGIILIYFCLFPSLDYFCICFCKQHFCSNQTTLFPLCQTSTFAYLSNNFVLITTTNYQLNNLLLPTCSLFQPICHLFCVPFINSLQQPYCLNYSTFATTYLRNFATNFTFFCNFLSTSNRSTHFFNNQPFNQIFSFQFSHFIFLFSIDPP